MTDLHVVKQATCALLSLQEYIRPYKLLVVQSQVEILVQ